VLLGLGGGDPPPSPVVPGGPLPAANAEGKSMSLTSDQRKEAVDYLVANCDSWKFQNAPEHIKGIPLEALGELIAEAEKARAVANAAKAPPPAPAVAAPVTPESRLSPEEREDLAFAREAKERLKQSLVQQITANVAAEQRPARAQRLMAKPLAELQELAELVPAPAQQGQVANAAPLYLGAAAPAFGGGKDDSDNLLPAMVFNFDQPAATAAQ
jgi:hypothetical protein